MNHMKFNITNALLLNNSKSKYVRIYYTEKSSQKLQSFNDKAQNQHPIALAMGVDGSQYKGKGYVAASCSTLDIYATAQTAEQYSDKHEAAALELGLLLTHYLLLPRIHKNATVQLFTDQIHMPQKWSGEQRCRKDKYGEILSTLIHNYHDNRILVAYSPSHQGAEHKDHKVADSLIHSMRDRTPITNNQEKRIKHQTEAEFKHQLTLATKHERRIMTELKEFPIGSSIKAEIKGFSPNSTITRPSEIKPTTQLKVTTRKKTKPGGHIKQSSTTLLSDIHRLLSTPPRK